MTFGLLDYLDSQIEDYDRILRDPTLSEHTRKNFEYLKAYALWFKACNSGASLSERKMLLDKKEESRIDASKSMQEYLENFSSL